MFYFRISWETVIFCQANKFIHSFRYSAVLRESYRIASTQRHYWRVYPYGCTLAWVKITDISDGVGRVRHLVDQVGFGSEQLTHVGLCLNWRHVGGCRIVWKWSVSSRESRRRQWSMMHSVSQLLLLLLLKTGRRGRWFWDQNDYEFGVILRALTTTKLSRTRGRCGRPILRAWRPCRPGSTRTRGAGRASRRRRTLPSRRRRAGQTPGRGSWSSWRAGVRRHGRGAAGRPRPTQRRSSMISTARRRRTRASWSRLGLIAARSRDVEKCTRSAHISSRIYALTLVSGILTKNRPMLTF